MSIDKTKEDIKKKLTLSDYPTNTPTHQEVKTPKQEKVKITAYLTEEHWEMFNKLCLEEMKRSGKPEKSQILCDAIDLLYKSRAGGN